MPEIDSRAEHTQLACHSHSFCQVICEWYCTCSAYVILTHAIIIIDLTVQLELATFTMYRGAD